MAYRCTGNDVLQTEPSHFITRWHHFREQDTETGDGDDARKRDEKLLHIEFPSQLAEISGQRRMKYGKRKQGRIASLTYLVAKIDIRETDTTPHSGEYKDAISN